MRKSKLVSVIIPTYERIEKLKRAIISVLIQTYTNFEILVVNDSLNELPVKELIYNLNDKRIKYFRNNRTKGANGARNTGIVNAKGKYIAFLDDDDEWLLGKLERQLNSLTKKHSNECGGVYSSYFIQEKKKWVKKEGKIEGNFTRELLLDKVSIAIGSNLLIYKKCIDAVGLWDESLYRQQDIEFLLRFLNKYKLTYCNSVGSKIYGHNTPNPQKAYNEREKYEKKIRIYIKELSKKDQKIFYSNHYRRQAIYLFKLKQRKKGVEYWEKGFKMKRFVLRKDIKLILSLIKNISI